MESVDTENQHLDMVLLHEDDDQRKRKDNN